MQEEQSLGAGKRAVLKTGKNLEAREQLGDSQQSCGGAWRPEQETRVSLAGGGDAKRQTDYR